MTARSVARLAACALAIWVSGCADGGPAAPTITRDPIDAPFVSVTAGADYSCGLTARGTVYCWGSNAVVRPASGAPDRCGKDTDSFDCFKTPARVEGLPPLRSLEGDDYHACGLTGAGEAWCWGFGSSGVLANGATDSLPYPPGPVVGGVTWRALGLGPENTCGIAPDGAAYCWGETRGGAIGDGAAGDNGVDARMPTRVASPVPMTAIVSGFQFGCGLAESGAARCWGDIHSIPLRGRCSFGPCNRVPDPLPGSLRFRALTAGERHACGVASDGSAYCWGSNSVGELGNGASETAVNPEVPRRVLSSEPFSVVVAGREMTCGLTADGAAYCWGGNYSGRFGSGPAHSSAVPVPAASGLRLKWMALGENHTCGIALDGLAYCWGRNDWGGLGNGTEQASHVPVVVSGQR